MYYDTAAEFLTRYGAFIDVVAKLKAENGLCAAVYTELADIEAEPTASRPTIACSKLTPQR